MSRFRFIIRLDDIAPNMHAENFSRLRELFSKHRVRPLFGLIPDNCDAELLKFPPIDADFWVEMRKLIDAGWECAVHGYQHLSINNDSGLLRRNKHSEFAALSLEEQVAKLKAGTAILQRHEISSDVFMPPWHSYDHTTLRALRECGFKSITDGFALYPYHSDGLLFVPQLFAKPRQYPFGLFTFCLHLNHFRSQDFQDLEWFLEKHADACIPFSDAARFVPAPTFQALNRFVGQTLEALRLMRRSQTADG